MDRTANYLPPLLGLFRKEWPRDFAGSHKPSDDKSCLEEEIEGIRAQGQEFDGDEIQLFWNWYDDGSLRSDIRKAIRFLRDMESTKIDENRLPRSRGTAWLDDRTYNRSMLQQSSAREALPDQYAKRLSMGSLTNELGGDAPLSPRTYHAPLTADELYYYLKEKRFDHPYQSDADRRLIHISDPDSYDLLALMRTCPAHQQGSLQDIICKYLTMGTFVAVTIPEDAEHLFQLELHIPYFALRRSSPDQASSQRKSRAQRGWMNIDFLDAKEVISDDNRVLGIHQAHISLTICGTDNSRWVAYCFEDRYFDEDAETGPDDQTADHQSDQIANGDIGAEDIIWDPREYYFRVFLIRMRKVQEEWNELVLFIESAIKRHSWGRLFFHPTQYNIPSNFSDTAISIWIDPTMQLLGKLIEELVKINFAWQNFASEDGDLAYFSDTHLNSRMVRTVIQLRNIFGKMLQLETRLRHMVEQCGNRTQTFNLHLTCENRRNSELTVYFISPLAIVSTFFAIPAPGIIWFERNVVSFLVVLLLYMVVLKALLFCWGSRIGRHHWGKLARKAKVVWNRDSISIKKNEAGNKVLHKRNAFAAPV